MCTARLPGPQVPRSPFMIPPASRAISRHLQSLRSDRRLLGFGQGSFSSDTGLSEVFSCTSRIAVAMPGEGASSNPILQGITARDVDLDPHSLLPMDFCRRPRSVRLMTASRLRPRDAVLCSKNKTLWLCMRPGFHASAFVSDLVR